jgi:hypothetical protein
MRSKAHQERDRSLRRNSKVAREEFWKRTNAPGIVFVNALSPGERLALAALVPKQGCAECSNTIPIDEGPKCTKYLSWSLSNYLCN